MSAGETPTAQQLRKAGLRVTAPRYTVLEWVTEHPHATAEQIATGVRERLGAISRQGMYDVLAACVGAGLLRQIEPAGHPARFERRTDDNHHHLVCHRCGAVEDVDCLVGVRPCLAPADTRGFVIDEAEVVLWGRCAVCRADATTRQEPTPEAAAAHPRHERGDRQHAADTMEA